MKRLLYYLTFTLLAIVLVPELAFSQAKVWTAKADQAYNKKDWGKAIEFYTKAITKDSSEKYTFYKRGVSYLNTMVLDEAVKDFTKAIVLDSNFADAYNNRGLALSFTEDQIGAINDFNAALALDSTNAMAYINRGVSCVNLMNYYVAYKDFARAISLSPENPSAYFQRAIAYYRQRKYDSAAEDYSKAIQYGIDNSKSYYSRGNCYYNMNQYDEAISDYTVALKTDPENVEILNNRAVAYDKIGKNEKAEADRKLINKINGFTVDLTPIEQIKFKTFACDSDSSYSLQLPDSWSCVTGQDSNSINMNVSLNKINTFNDFFAVGVNISLTKNMSAKYGVKDTKEIIDFWKGSIAKNANSYFKYNVYSEKQKQIGQWSTVKNTVSMKFSKDSYNIMMFEYAMVKENTILYAYFQAPEDLWEYYEKIFTKAIESLVIK